MIVCGADALPVDVVHGPAGHAVEVADLALARQLRDRAPAQAHRVLDEAGDAELVGLRVEAGERVLDAVDAPAAADPRQDAAESPPGALGTASDRKRLIAGATAMPPSPAANVPSSAARPIGSPSRGVGVGRSMA